VTTEEGEKTVEQRTQSRKPRKGNVLRLSGGEGEKELIEIDFKEPLNETCNLEFSRADVEPFFIWSGGEPEVRPKS